MLGAIIGDIIGSRFEFGNAPRKGFELFTDECSFTDDTVCTIAVADAVLNERSYKDRFSNGVPAIRNRWAATAADSSRGSDRLTLHPQTHLATGQQCVSAPSGGYSTVFTQCLTRPDVRPK